MTLVLDAGAFVAADRGDGEIAAAIAGEPLDEDLGRRAGALLALSSATDVIAAAVVLLADDGDEILTSNPHDLAVLAAATGKDVELISV